MPQCTFAASPLPMFNSPSVCWAQLPGVSSLFSLDRKQWQRILKHLTEVKDRWCSLAKGSLGSSIPERLCKNQSKAMAHLLFPFVMRQMHYDAQLHRNAHFYNIKTYSSHFNSLLAPWSLVSKKPAKTTKNKKWKSNRMKCETHKIKVCVTKRRQRNEWLIKCFSGG